MPTPSQAMIVTELKRSLREQGHTYEDVAAELGLSVASVKRLFSTQDFSLERVDRICGMLGLALPDLIDRARERGTSAKQLTLEQEQQIVADPQLLLVTWLVLGRMPLDAIVRRYAFSEREVLKHFIHLDRLKVIELQPGNRVRLLISRHFSWRAGGPVQRYIHEKLLRDFLGGHFAAPDEEFYFHGGEVSHATLLELKRVLRAAARDCTALVDQERAAADTTRGAAFVLALRPWRFKGFRQFERDQS